MLLSVRNWSKKWGLLCKIPQKKGIDQIPYFNISPHFQPTDNTLWHIATFPGFNVGKEDIDSHFVIYFFIFRYFWILGETICSGARLILGNLTARFPCKNCYSYKRISKSEGGRRKSKKVGITGLTMVLFHMQKE